MINEIYTNSQGLDFKVLSLDKVDENYKKYYTIKFLKSKYTLNNVRSDLIKNGSVQDKLQISLCGIGIIGYANTRQNWRPYKLWSNMIRRCYDLNDKSYRYYGAKGVTVNERWHRFDFFLEDITKIEGYNVELFEEGILKLDKDMKSQSQNKQYSLTNCVFVNDMKNQKQRAREYNATHIKIAVFPDGHEEQIDNVTDFCIKHNLHRQNVNLVLAKKQKSTKGFRFYKK